MIGYTLVEFKLALLYFINVDGLQAEFIKRLSCCVHIRLPGCSNYQ